MSLIVSMPVEANKAHLRDPDGDRPHDPLCRARRWRGQLYGESNMTGPEWTVEVLLHADFLCRTCARRAGLR